MEYPRNFSELIPFIKREILLINSDELSFDITVVIFLIVFDFMLSNSALSIRDLAYSYKGLIILGFIQFFISFQAGVLLKKSNYKFIYSASVFLLLASIFLTSLELPALEEWGEYQLVNGGIGSFFLLIGGILSGIASQKASFDKIAKRVGLVFFIGIVVSISIFIFHILIIEHRISMPQHYLTIFTLYTGTIIGAWFLFMFLPVRIARLIMQLNSKTKRYLKIFFAVLTSLSFMYWQSFVMNYKEAKDFILLLYFGIIFFRFLMSMAPPRKLLNMIFAILIILMDIYSFR